MSTRAARPVLRRRLLLAGLLPILVALVLAAKVALMLGHDRDGRAALAGGDWAAARDSFAANGTLNLLQAWVAPYDEGVARFRLEDHEGALDAFETALAAAPPEEQCRVRVNLALSHEALGDRAALGQEAADTTAARVAWRRGREVLGRGGCVAEDQTARRVDERLRDKLATSRPEEPTEPTEPQEPEESDEGDQPPPDAEQAEELERRNRAGQEQREQQVQRDRRRGDPQGRAPSGQDGPPLPTW